MGKDASAGPNRWGAGPNRWGAESTPTN